MRELLTVSLVTFGAGYALIYIIQAATFIWQHCYCGAMQF